MEKVPDDTRALISRLDQRIREAQAKHAFTPVRLEGCGGTDWLWKCMCGENFIQLEGEDIHQRLVDHAKGIES